MPTSQGFPPSWVYQRLRWGRTDRRLFTTFKPSSYHTSLGTHHQGNGWWPTQGTTLTYTALNINPCSLADCKVHNAHAAGPPRTNNGHVDQRHRRRLIRQTSPPTTDGSSERRSRQRHLRRARRLRPRPPPTPTPTHEVANTETRTRPALSPTEPESPTLAPTESTTTQSPTHPPTEPPTTQSSNSHRPYPRQQCHRHRRRPSPSQRSH